MNEFAPKQYGYPLENGSYQSLWHRNEFILLIVLFILLVIVLFITL